MGTLTIQHTFEADDQAEYQRAVNQLDEYQANPNNPSLDSRIDDEANLRITYTKITQQAPA